MSQPDNEVTLQDAYEAAMNRLIAIQQALVLAEAQVLTLKKTIVRMQEVIPGDEGGVDSTD